MILPKQTARSHIDKQIFLYHDYTFTCICQEIYWWTISNDLVEGIALKHFRQSPRATRTRKMVSGGSNYSSSTLGTLIRGVREHTLTLSRWAAAPSQWCSTRHTWTGIPSPPSRPSYKLCQWLPYLPRTERCWLFCTRQLRSLRWQKTEPGSSAMSKLVTTQHKEISFATGLRNFPPREKGIIINSEIIQRSYLSKLHSQNSGQHSARKNTSTIVNPLCPPE